MKASYLYIAGLFAAGMVFSGSASAAPLGEDSAAVYSSGIIRGTATPENVLSSSGAASVSSAEPTPTPSFKPTFRLGGYVTAKYDAADRESAPGSGNFSLRYLRLYGSGEVWNHIFYRFQAELTGTPRLLDAYVEWRRYKFAQVRLGQYHRPFGFDKPLVGFTVGLGTFSQVASKLQSLNDRIGEPVSSGRDAGVQVQGDLFPTADGHPFLHYQVGLFNGQGLNRAEADHFKDLIGGAWITPLRGLDIGAFGWNGRYTDAATSRRLARKRYGLGVRYEGRWSARAEYVHSHGGTVKGGPAESDGWYALAGAPVPGFERLKLYGRWDCYRDDATTWQGLKTNWGVAANYWLDKNFLFQVTCTHTDDRGAASASARHFNTLDVQVTARF